MATDSIIEPAPAPGRELKPISLRREEARIVWISDPAEFPYVREALACSPRRGGPVPVSWQLVGFAELSKDVKSYNRRFLRRIFYVTPWDRCNDKNGVYKTLAPCEAVLPWVQGETA